MSWMFYVRETALKMTTYNANQYKKKNAFRSLCKLNQDMQRPNPRTFGIKCIAVGDNILHRLRNWRRPRVWKHVCGSVYEFESGIGTQ